MAQPSIASAIWSLLLFWSGTEVIVKRYPGGMLEIKDKKGTPLFKVKSSDTKVHNQRLLLDNDETVIATIRSKIRTVHDRWNVFRGEQRDANNLVFSASRNQIIQGHTHVDVSLPHSDDFAIKIEGSWSNKDCVVSYCDSSKAITMAKMRPGDSPDEFIVKIHDKKCSSFVVAIIATVDAMKTPVAKRAVAKRAIAVAKGAVTVAVSTVRVAPLLGLAI